MSRFEPKVRSWSAISRSLPQFAPARRPHARRRLTRPNALEDRTVLSTIALNNATRHAPSLATPPCERRSPRRSTGRPRPSPFTNVFKTPQKIDLTGPLPDLKNTTGQRRSRARGGRDGQRRRVSRVFLVDAGVPRLSRHDDRWR